MINPVVDALNAISLASGLPMSVVDLDLLRAPLSIRLAPADSSYVFNPAGQTMALEGLLCLYDADGPCANAVKDSQRAKTRPETQRCLCVVWGTHAVGEELSDRVAESYAKALIDLGATAVELG